MDYSQQKIQGINLIFFIGSSIIAIFFNMKNRKIKLEIAKPSIVYGCIGTVIGAILSNKINSKNLKKYFGIFLILIAINGIYPFISQYMIDKKVKNKKVK